MRMQGRIAQVVIPALQASKFAREHVAPHQQPQEYVLPRQQQVHVVQGMKKVTFPPPKFLPPITIAQTLI